MKVQCKCGAYVDTKLTSKHAEANGRTRPYDTVSAECACGHKAAAGGFNAAIDHLEKEVKEKMLG